MNKALSIALLVLGVWLSSGTSLADERNGVTVGETSLRETPAASSRELQKLPGKTPVIILKRQGGWYEVETSAGRRGWLAMLSVRYDKTAGVKSSNLGNLLQSSAQAAPAGGVATGVRGMTEEQLAQAGASGTSSSSVPAGPLQTLERYAVSANDARTFAQDGGLRSQTIGYAP